jgi:hemolysin type calcium-binding protein/calcineurin-like phosphoesterase family protein
MGRKFRHYRPLKTMCARTACTDRGFTEMVTGARDIGTLVRALLASAVVSLVMLFPGAVSVRAADPVIAAAGDIACDPADPYFYQGLGDSTHCRQRYVSNLLVNAGLAAVLPLGDIQYDSASASDIQASYHPSWGRVKSISRPALGNHEPGSATGYFDYFNGKGARSGPAGERGKGYYSFNVGTWHLIALNSNCARVPCGVGSAQERWLRADLAANQPVCTLAYWHHPRFSSGHDGNNTFMQPLWKALYEGGAEVALTGHSHNYERFAPMDGNAKRDKPKGIREFVVGTGGAFFTGVGSAKPNSEVRQNHTFGVLKITLRPTSYAWSFAPEAGKKFADSGTEACHGPSVVAAPPATPPSGSPTAPAVVNPKTGAPNGRHAVQCTISGTNGRDVLRGTSGRDVICGLGGNDRIRGLGGSDVILGGLGHDRISGGRGNDRLYGNAGRDLLRGQSGNDQLVGGAGRDRLYGNAGRDELSTLDGKRGDSLSGGRGRDRATVDRGDRTRLIERLRRR